MAGMSNVTVRVLCCPGGGGKPRVRRIQDNVEVEKQKYVRVTGIVSDIKLI